MKKNLLLSKLKRAILDNICGDEIEIKDGWIEISFFFIIKFGMIAMVLLAAYLICRFAF